MGIWGDRGTQRMRAEICFPTAGADGDINLIATARVVLINTWRLTVKREPPACHSLNCGTPTFSPLPSRIPQVFTVKSTEKSKIYSKNNLYSKK